MSRLKYHFANISGIPFQQTFICINDGIHVRQGTMLNRMPEIPRSLPLLLTISFQIYIYRSLGCQSDCC